MLQRGSVQFYPESRFVHWSNDALFNLPVTVNQQIVRYPVDQGLGRPLHGENGKGELAHGCPRNTKFPGRAQPKSLADTVYHINTRSSANSPPAHSIALLNAPAI